MDARGPSGLEWKKFSATGIPPESGFKFIQYIDRRQITINQNIFVQDDSKPGFLKRLRAVAERKMPIQQFLDEFYDGKIMNAPEEVRSVLTSTKN